MLTNIITAVLGCAVGQIRRKCCDCVVHRSEVWTWLHRFKSHTCSLKEQFLLCTSLFLTAQHNHSFPPLGPAAQSGGATRFGRGTLEYQRVRTNQSSITRALQLIPSASQSLRQKFQEKEWLGLTASPTEEQLVTLVLGRIEQDVNQFGEFIAMLRDIEGMDQIVNTMTGMTFLLLV